MKINFRYKKDGKQATIIEYLLHFLAQHPLKPTSIFFVENALNGEGVNVYYGIPKQQSKDYFIPKQNLVFEQTETDSSSLFSNNYRYEQSLLYSIEKNSKPEEPFIIDNNFQFDILETIFFHISRFEEVFAAKENLNQAGWLDEKKHFLIRTGLHQIPVVDQLVVAFFKTISGTKIHQRTRYDISHDVDILYRLTPLLKFLRSLAANLIYNRGFKDLQNTLRYWWKMQTKGLKDPYDNFEQLLRKESIWKSKQLFLMVGGNTKFDNKYSFDHLHVDNIIQMALERGYEIGLHPSYNAGFEQKIYVEEIKRLSGKLKQPIRLNRQHWLRFNWEITPYLWEENGIEIDYSMGYNQHLGFRCGTGFVYQMFDFKSNKAFHWKEQPLAFMESAAIHYAKNTGKDLRSIMIDFLEKNKFNTHINSNFHNSNFDPLLETGRILRKFYEEELIQIIER